MPCSYMSVKLQAWQDIVDTEFVLLIVGSALCCLLANSCRWVQANDSMVVLEPVPYGTAGPFAINVWAKVGSLAGSQFEYVLSQNSTIPDTSSWGPSQVRPPQASLHRHLICPKGVVASQPPECHFQRHSCLL